MRLTRIQPSRDFASRTFTNRDNHLDLGRTQVEKLLQEKDYFRLISFYGIGGIGKTSLLSQIKKVSPHQRVRWITLDLESGSITSPTDAIYEIYRASGVRYYPLEYAFALIWAHKGRTISDIRNRLIEQDGLVTDLGDASLEAASAIVNVKGIRRLLEISTDAVKKRKPEYVNEVERIDLASDSDRERLLQSF